ncbi:hypothetical protein HYV44_01090 [Candidatus Microgenomates bacterium]|nr:hypothetical protein [Candidatus Microgenomates bacterium]
MKIYFYFIIFIFLFLVLLPLFSFASGTGNFVQQILSGVVSLPPSYVMTEKDTTPPDILDLRITDITDNSAKVKWRTSELAICKSSWRKNFDLDVLGYNDFVFEETLFAFDHLVHLEDLKADVSGISDQEYLILLTCRDSSGNQSDLMEKTFRAQETPDTVPPGQVTNWRATLSGHDVLLQWNNPIDADFAGVLINRVVFEGNSHGAEEKIFSGEAEYFLDTNLSFGDYVYLIYTYDRLNNYSAGLPLFVTVADSAVPVPRGVILDKIPEIKDGSAELEFWQDNIGIRSFGDIVNIKSDQDLAVILNARLVNLGATHAVLLLFGETDMMFPFRPGRNQYQVAFVGEKTIYGEKRFAVVFLDKNNEPLSFLEGTIKGDEDIDPTGRKISVEIKKIAFERIWYLFEKSILPFFSGIWSLGHLFLFNIWLLFS